MLGTEDGAKLGTVSTQATTQKCVNTDGLINLSHQCPLNCSLQHISHVRIQVRANLYGHVMLLILEGKKFMSGLRNASWCDCPGDAPTHIFLCRFIDGIVEGTKVSGCQFPLLFGFKLDAKGIWSICTISAPRINFEKVK